MKKSPIKLKKFIRDKKKDSTNILMNEKVVVEELSPSDIQFEHRERLRYPSPKKTWFFKVIEGEKKPLVTCNNWQLKQKLKHCKRNWYVNALLYDGTRKITLNFYNEVVMKLVKKADDTKCNTEDEEVVSNLLLELPEIRCVYKEKTRAVEDVDW
eukprot:gene11583-12776_t